MTTKHDVSRAALKPTPAQPTTLFALVDATRPKMARVLTPPPSPEEDAEAVWKKTFHLVESRLSPRNSYKTSLACLTTWVGLLDGQRLRFRICPRTRVVGEHFLTSSNQRLRASHVGRFGHFLDIEMLEGPSNGELAERLARMACDADAEGRPARVRARRERFRQRSLAHDALGDDCVCALPRELRGLLDEEGSL